MTGQRLDVSFVSSGHDVADARLHRIAAAVIASGLTVEVIGLGDRDGGPAGAHVRTSQRAPLWRRALTALSSPWGARGAILVCLDPDVAIGSALVRALRRRLLVVDVHEDYAALLRDRTWATGLRGRIARGAVAVATAVAARADLTVVADDTLPPPRPRCRHRLVVRNEPDRALLAAVRAGPAAAGHRAVYVGDVRRSRGLAVMIDALAQAPDWTLDIVGPVSVADASWLAARIAAPDVAGRVRVHGRKPPAAAWRIAGGADVGLALLDDTPAFRAALPTKVAEYLCAGMAVLATPLPRVERVLAESSGGTTVRTAGEAGAVLQQWSGTGAAELRQMKTAAMIWADSQAAEPSPYEELAAALADMRSRRRPFR
jgi:glycosyltransferase involved in cell wall biosynthesis